MDYTQAVSYLYSLGNEVATAKLGLENIRKLLGYLNDPQDRFRSVLIAGTNGKGSAAAFCESVLRTHGYRTGLYTSPHLVRIEERIRINGLEIFPEDFARLTRIVKEAVEKLLAGASCNGQRLKLNFHPTYFEMVTAIAFLHFAEKKVEIAILEVGLGGRLDATNVVDPIASVITSISYDHQAVLGNSLEAIAREKAGIIKPVRAAGHGKKLQLPVVCSSEDKLVLEVIRKQCQSTGARLVPAFQDLKFRVAHNALEDFSLDLWPVLGSKLELRVPLAGGHQVGNVLAAVRTLEILHRSGFPLRLASFEQGIARTRWPGRLEVLPTRPRVVLDGAHNAAAAESVSKHIRSFLAPQRVILIYGSLRDKDIAGIFSHLSRLAREVILTRPDSERGVPPQEIIKTGCTRGRVIHRAETAEAAWELAHSLAQPEDTLLVMGSLFLVGDVKRCFTEADPGQPPPESTDREVAIPVSGTGPLRTDAGPTRTPSGKADSFAEAQIPSSH